MQCVEYIFNVCTVQSTPCMYVPCKVNLVGMYCEEYTQYVCTVSKVRLVGIHCKVHLVWRYCVEKTLYFVSVIKHERDCKRNFKFTIHAKMEIPDLQLYP